MLNGTARYLLAAIQAIIGWEWLMSGSNKLLSGTFPQGLADALGDGIKNNPNGWYVSFLQRIVLPNSVFFGYLIEWTEILVSIILIGGAVILLTRPRPKGDPQYKVAIAYCTLVVIAAIIGAFQTINFHFWMGGWVIPTFNASAPFDEGIDLDGLLPLFFLIIIVANLALIQDLTGKKLFRLASQQVHPVSSES